MISMAQRQTVRDMALAAYRRAWGDEKLESLSEPRKAAIVESYRLLWHQERVQARREDAARLEEVKRAAVLASGDAAEIKRQARLIIRRVRDRDARDAEEAGRVEREINERLDAWRAARFLSYRSVA